MELGLGLGLSLGDAPKFMENKVQKQQQQLQKSGSKNTRGPDFCMALSLKSCAVLENQRKEETKKSQESDEDDEISEEDGSHYNIGETPLQLNLLPLAPLFPRHISNRPWSSDNGSWENGSSGNMGLAAAKALDVNRWQGAAAAAAEEEVPSANSVGSSPFHMDYGMYRTGRSSGNGKHLSKREFAATRNDVVVEVERARDDEDDEEENGAQNRKKLKLSKQQSAFLEETFKQHNSLNPKQKLALAKQLHLRPRQVEVWFQNRRARTKLKQTEVDCDYLKRFCDTLREENRRLQKELQEVRVLNTSNIPFYMSRLPPTTLTICPSCQRAAAPAAAPPPKAVPIPPKHVQILPFFANYKSS